MNVDGVAYQIYLTAPEHDYIQLKLAERGVPYGLSMLRDMKNRLGHGSTVIDIGAYIGNYTFYLANVVHANVLALEADLHLVRGMHITLAECGLKDQVSIYSLSQGDESALGDSDKGPLQPVELTKINICTLDSLEITSAVDAIKVDVGGMELEVLIGARDTIENHKPLLYIASYTKEHFLNVLNYLTDLGYGYISTFNTISTHLYMYQPMLERDTQAGDQLTSIGAAVQQYELMTEIENYKNELSDYHSRYLKVYDLNLNLKKQIDDLKSELGKHRRSDAHVVEKTHQLMSERKDKELLLARHNTVIMEQGTAKKTIAELSFVLESMQSRISQLHREKQILENDLNDGKQMIQKKENTHKSILSQLKIEQEKKVRDINALYTQQLQYFLNKKIENLALLRLNQEKIKQLNEYRSAIEQKHPEPRLLSESTLTNYFGLDVLKEKKRALDELASYAASLDERLLHSKGTDS